MSSSVNPLGRSQAGVKKEHQLVGERTLPSVPMTGAGTVSVDAATGVNCVAGSMPPGGTLGVAERAGSTGPADVQPRTSAVITAGSSRRKR